MKRFLRLFAALLLLAFAAMIIAGIAARFSDGPIGPFAGGPFQAGERVQESLKNWDIYRGVREADLQLEQPPRSRRVWILVEDGNLYVPAGFIKSVPFWKQWPHEAMEDGRALIRVENKIYPVELVRVQNPTLYQKLLEGLGRKYDLPKPEGEPDKDNTWVFHLAPRSSS